MLGPVPYPSPIPGSMANPHFGCKRAQLGPSQWAPVAPAVELRVLCLPGCASLWACAVPPPVIPLTMYLVPPRQVGTAGWPLSGRVRSTDWLGSSGRWAHAFPNPDTQDPSQGTQGIQGPQVPAGRSFSPSVLLPSLFLARSSSSILAISPFNKTSPSLPTLIRSSPSFKPPPTRCVLHPLSVCSDQCCFRLLSIVEPFFVLTKVAFVEPLLCFPRRLFPWFHDSKTIPLEPPDR